MDGGVRIMDGPKLLSSLSFVSGAVLFIVMPVLSALRLIDSPDYQEHLQQY